MAIDPSAASRKKKILVLVSRGGGGHKTAAAAIDEILKDDHEIEINYVLQDILAPIDFLNVLTRGYFTGEDLYNFLLRRHQKKLLLWMIEAGKKRMKSRLIERLFDAYLSKLSQKPDLIISPTPWINYGVACAAHRHNIPFIIIPTDLDGSTFLHGFPQLPTPLNFKLALPYDDPLIRETTLQNRELQESQLMVSGFPVRPACCRSYSFQEKRKIQEAFHLSHSHQTVTLVMGAVGGNLILEHVKSLMMLQPQLHGLSLQLSICTGHNKKAFAKIKELLSRQGSPLGENSFTLPSGLIIHVYGFIPNLIDLMAVSDLIITKTGSCTVNEAIYLEKKVILDNTKHSTARFLPWENFNIPFVEQNGLGSSFTESGQLPMLVLSLLKFPRVSSSGMVRRVSFEEKLTKEVDSALKG